MLASRDLHIRSTRTGADSRSQPDFEPETSMILAFFIASRTRGDVFSERAIESAMALASRLDGAVASEVSSARKGDSGQRRET
jgi:hypothetical protein